MDQGSKIIEFFLTPIRNILKSGKRPVDNTVSETDKGLDVQFESSIPFVQPNFGNNQEMQLILIGTKWCGAGDVAKNKRDIGYFYMTGECWAKQKVPLQLIQILPQIPAAALMTCAPSISNPKTLDSD